MMRRTFFQSSRHEVGGSLPGGGGETFSWCRMTASWFSSIPEQLSVCRDDIHIQEQHRDESVSLFSRESFRANDVTMTELPFGMMNSLTWSNRQDYVQRSLLDAYRKEHGGLGFGKFFSDHMMSIDHKDDGWSRPRITSLRSIVLHPASQVLHYGMSCFEGMKVYRNAHDPSVLQFFRPALNMERFLRSAGRLHLPSFCPRELLECIRMLVRMDQGWVPKERGQSLYIRPVLYSSSNILGVSSPQESFLNIIMSPSGNYFGKDMNAPIRMYVEEQHVRAWPGGAGDAKISGNYAPTIYPQASAKKRFGADQVVFTSMREVSYFEECGAMNIFFILRHNDEKIEVVTPPLHGTILPGVTRQSILEIVQEWKKHKDGDIFATERAVSVNEVRKAATDGSLLEMFACGTASVVQPIGSLVREGGEEIIPIRPCGTITTQIYDALVDIQHGIHDNPIFDSWSVQV